MDQRYIEFFLNSKRDIVQVETFEISHPSFSDVFYLVRNAIKGFTAQLETSELVTFEYVPMQISASGIKDDMDEKIELTIGDVGEILPQQIDLMSQDDSFDVMPSLVYRVYRSDDITSPMLGPVRLEITEITFKKEGSLIVARAPRFNVNKTGERYTIERFPMLRSCL